MLPRTDRTSFEQSAQLVVWQLTRLAVEDEREAQLSSLEAVRRRVCLYRGGAGHLWKVSPSKGYQHLLSTRQPLHFLLASPAFTASQRRRFRTGIVFLAV